MSEFPSMHLSEVGDEWLRAWVDAGYMSPADYYAEMQRREAERSASASDNSRQNSGGVPESDQ